MYNVYYGDEVIASFKDKTDAEHYLKWKTIQLGHAFSDKQAEKYIAEHPGTQPGEIPIAETIEEYKQYMQMVEGNVKVIDDTIR